MIGFNSYLNLMESNNLLLKDLLAPYDYQSTGIKGGFNEVRVMADNRVEAREKIINNLSNARVQYRDGKQASTSIPGFKTIDITLEDNKFRIFIKPKRQSGAGAETTALGESLQAYACSARQAKRRPLTSADEIFELNGGDSAYADRTLAQCEKLPDNWQYTAYMTANALAKFLGSGKYMFHRGGRFVDRLEKEFKYHQKREKIGITNINKWTPADMWAVRRGFQLPNKFTSLGEYNQALLDAFNNRDLVGVSLKVLKPGSKPKQELYNTKEIISNVKLLGFSTTLKAKDVYIEFSNAGKAGKMQLRTFSSGMSGWQGEIKGAAAAGGKVSGGPLETFLRDIGITKFVSAAAAKSHVKRVTPNLVNEFVKFAKVVDPSLKRADIDLMVKSNNPNWLYSKYLGWQYAYLLGTSTTRVQKQLLGDIVGYASSATRYSAAFVKYS